MFTFIWYCTMYTICSFRTCMNWCKWIQRCTYCILSPLPAHQWWMIYSDRDNFPFQYFTCDKLCYNGNLWQCVFHNSVLCLVSRNCVNVISVDTQAPPAVYYISSIRLFFNGTSRCISSSLFKIYWHIGVLTKSNSIWRTNAIFWCLCW